MLDLQRPDSTTITRLRVKGSSLDPLPARLRVAGMLNGVSLAPPGMPPSAVLVLRRFDDPLPGRITLQHSTTRVDPTWEQAARRKLADLFRLAARPIAGYLPAESGAVLFADEGEMLACLALDQSRGVAAERWWWRSLLGRVPPAGGAGLRAILIEHAPVVPAALAYLERHGQARAVVEVLSPTQALAVLTAVTGAHGLGSFAFDEPGLAEPRQTHIAPAGQQAAGPGEATPARAETGRTLPPWEHYLSPTIRPAVQILGRERACLLGVSLTLHRAPAAVRSQTFRRDLRAWWTAPPQSSSGIRTIENPPATERPPSTAPSPHSPLLTPGDVPHEPAGRGRATTLPAAEREGTIESRLPAGTPGVSAPKADAIRPGDRRPAATGERTGAAGAERTMHPASPAPLPLQSQGEMRGDSSPSPGMEVEAASPLNGRPPPATSAAEEAAEETAILLEGGVDTRIGGVLFLINLMCRLDLPACFEDEWRLATSLGSWGVLEALGRALLERDGEAMHADPLWPALAVLAGRAPEEPLGELVKGTRFHLPPAWHWPTAEDGKERYSWAADATWLRLWSDRGYMLVEEELESRTPAGQARTALRAYDGGGRLRRRSAASLPITYPSGGLTAGMDHGLRHWLALVIPYLRIRIRRALRRPPEQALDLEHALLLRRGTLYVTSTHVDLAMPLNDISIDLRLAGLDRDPGWLPDFGRVIKFHFD